MTSKSRNERSIPNAATTHDAGAATPGAPLRRAARATDSGAASGAVSGRMTLRLVRMLGARGCDAAAVCRKAGVSLEEVSSPVARVPYRLADALLDASVEELGIETFALDLAGFVDPETYDAAGLVLMSSTTFGEGLERALGYQRLWADGERFTFERTREGAVLRFQHLGPSSIARAVLAELAFLETMAAARTLVAAQARPAWVRFSHRAATGSAAELARALGAVPGFGASRNELALDHELLAGHVRPPEGAVAAVFELFARRALSALPRAAATSARLEALLCEDLFEMSLPQAAAYLRMRARTLQRQLRNEGTSWSDVVDSARRKRVQELSLRGIAEKEIAYLVGYSDPSALARARKRWR